jgi:tRNA 5-methylaminomethyl-2-thiouridine biosynthesis bifunctional protein
MAEKESLDVAALLHASEVTTGWAGKPSWCILEADAASGPALFLSSWASWRADPHRSHLLHYVAACTHLDAWIGAATATQKPTVTSHADVGRELASRLWGIEPTGWQRLSLDDGRLLLTLVAAADPIAALRRERLTADTIVLHAPEDPESSAFGMRSSDPHWWKALARLSRPGTRLVVASPAHSLRPASSIAEEATEVGDGPELPKIARAAGFTPLSLTHGTARPAATQESAPEHHRVLTLAQFAPAWIPNGGVRRAGASDQPVCVAPLHCIVVGAGVAGAAVAASLARRGWQVTVMEGADSVALGASSLPAGIFVPAASADDNALSRLTRAGVRSLIEFASARLEAGTDWQMSGVLQRFDDQEAADQVHQHRGVSTLAGWCKRAEAAQFKQAGLQAQSSRALWHTQAGWMKPARLVSALLATPGITVLCGSRISRITQDPSGNCTLIGADGSLLAQVPLVVVATGYESGALLGPAFALQPIAGQVTIGICTPGQAPPLKFPVNGNGSFIDDVPSADGKRYWFAGATFERDRSTSAATRVHVGAARAANLVRLSALLPSSAQRLQLQNDESHLLGDWRGVRGVAIDRLPVVGAVIAGEEFPGLWACTAMGSRGLSLGLLCAELLAAWLHQEPLPVSERLANQLAARRFSADASPQKKSSYAYSDKRKTNM